MRAAVRWRVPVSAVGSVASGLRWKLARRILVRSLSTTTAPSILQSSNNRFAVKETSSLKPSPPAARTFSVSPTQMRAPRRPAMIMSSATRSAVPGAVIFRAVAMRSSFSVALGSSCVGSMALPQLLAAYRLRFAFWCVCGFNLFQHFKYTVLLPARVVTVLRRRASRRATRWAARRVSRQELLPRELCVLAAIQKDPRQNLGSECLTRRKTSGRTNRLHYPVAARMVPC